MSLFVIHVRSLRIHGEKAMQIVTSFPSLYTLPPPVGYPSPIYTTHVSTAFPRN